MSTNEKINFIDKVLINTYPWNKNFKNLVIHKVKKAMPNVKDITINYYVCMVCEDGSSHSIHEIKDEFVIEQLYDLALFVKED